MLNGEVGEQTVRWGWPISATGRSIVFASSISEIKSHSHIYPMKKMKTVTKSRLGCKRSNSQNFYK